MFCSVLFTFGFDFTALEGSSHSSFILSGYCKMPDNIGLALVNSRLQTIARLEELADNIDRINRSARIATLAGTSASIIGMASSSIVLTSAGGPPAVPIGIAAAYVGGCSPTGRSRVNRNKDRK